MHTATVLVLDATRDELSRIRAMLEASPLPVSLSAARLSDDELPIRDSHRPDAVVLCSDDPVGALARLSPKSGDAPVIVLRRPPATERARKLVELGASEVLSMRRLARLPEVLARTLADVVSKQHGSVELHALFNTVLASVGDVVLVTRARTREIVICNDATRTVFGFAPAELIGATTERLFPDRESFEEFGAHMEEALERWGYCNTESMMRRRDGAEFEAQLHVTHLDSMFGLDDCVIGTIRDTSVVRSADRAVRETIEQLEGTLNSLQDVVLTVDPETRTILHCNPAVEKVFGYRMSEVIGQETEPFFPDTFTYDLVGRSYQEVLERKGVYRTELTIPHRDGHPVDVDITVTTLFPSQGWRHGIVAAIRDVTEQKRAQEQARLAGSVLANTVEAVLITDLDWRIVSVNPAFERLTGFKARNVIGKRPDMIRSGYHKPAFYRQIEQALHREGYWQGEIWRRRRDGETFPTMASASVVRDDAGNPTHYTSIFTDISHLKNVQERLEYLVRYDPLTGLANRRSFERTVEEATAHAERTNGMVAVLSLDIDHFNNVNEALGHDIGDRLLQAIARRLHEALGATDALARLGDDEFGILARDLEEPEAASILAKRLMQHLREPFHIDEHSLYADASIGISVMPADGRDFQTLLKNADSALFRAKERGRNSYEFFSRDLNIRAFETLVMVNSLRQALERNELLVQYQPRVSAKSGRIVGAEALVRWRHPELGLTMPSQFIPIAERTGLIGNLGQWVLENILACVSRWKEAGVEVVPVSMNLSGIQLADPDLVDELERQLKRFGLEPANLELEVTESILMSNPESVTGSLARLRRHGFSVAMDDFGTGYSSLNYLKQFPINGLKIDRTFVKDIPDSPDDVAITRAIIAMASSLGLQIVAEGVEKESQAEFLRQAGCHELQGFLYSPALSESEFVELLGTTQRIATGRH